MRELHAQAQDLSRTSEWLLSACTVGALLVLWAIQHGYAGLVHDARLYTFQALARLHPDIYAADVFLRFGSQDQFTIFSAFFAEAIRHVGAESAAAFLTALSHVIFLAGTVTLARVLMPTSYLWPAIALVYALPGDYGASGVFEVVEDFITPRLAAEGIVLLALAAWLTHRRSLAVALGAVAAAMHPLIAMAGVVVATLIDNHRRYPLALLLLGFVLVAAVVLLPALTGTPFVFDHQWLQLLTSGTKYLFPSLWSLQDWTHAAVPVFSLFVGALLLESGTTREVCRAGVLTAGLGVSLAYVFGDLLQLVPVVQLQLWRWTWIATFLATLLLPFIAHRLWSQGPASRTVLYLIVASWLLRNETYGLAVTACAGAALAYAVQAPKAVLPTPGQTWFARGALVLLGMASVQHLTTTFFDLAASDPSGASTAIRTIRGLSQSGVIPFAVFAVVLGIVRWASVATRTALTAVCAAALAGLLPTTAREWTARSFDSATYEAFAGWRNRIPQRAEVLWFDSPMAVWLLIERRSYLSRLQAASALFSRTAAMEIKRRVDAVARVLPSQADIAWADSPSAPQGRPTLAALCASADVRYVVTREDLAATPLAFAPAVVPAVYRALRLYGCEGSRG